VNDGDVHYIVETAIRDVLLSAVHNLRSELAELTARVTELEARP
jgi:BMFP domain-containing protein YqiC